MFNLLMLERLMNYQYCSFLSLGKHELVVFFAETVSLGFFGVGGKKAICRERLLLWAPAFYCSTGVAALVPVRTRLGAGSG